MRVQRASWAPGRSNILGFQQQTDSSSSSSSPISNDAFQQQQQQQQQPSPQQSSRPSFGGRRTPRRVSASIITSLSGGGGFGLGNSDNSLNDDAEAMNELRQSIASDDEKIGMEELHLLDVQSDREDDQKKNADELIPLKDAKKDLEKQLKELKFRLDSKVTLHEYAKPLASAKMKASDSTYILRFQSQLCKSLHKMGIAENQLKAALRYKDDIEKWGREEMKKITEEKSKMEVEYMNQLFELDLKMRSLSTSTADTAASTSASDDGNAGGDTDRNDNRSMLGMDVGSERSMGGPSSRRSLLHPIHDNDQFDEDGEEDDVSEDEKNSIAEDLNALDGLFSPSKYPELFDAPDDDDVGGYKEEKVEGNFQRRNSAPRRGFGAGLPMEVPVPTSLDDSLANLDSVLDNLEVSTMKQLHASHAGIAFGQSAGDAAEDDPASATAGSVMSRRTSNIAANVAAMRKSGLVL